MGATNDHPQARPTLASIAERVGVSRMTVSNAFNRPDQLSPELRRRILATAQELGYAGPDPVARTLSRGTTGSVGLVLDYRLTLALGDPATVELLQGVAAACEEREMGLSLVPRLTGRDAALVHTALVDGFVLHSIKPDDPRLTAVRERRLPYVLIDHHPVPGVTVVNVDDRAGARAMAGHLTALGHRRFAIALGWDDSAMTAAEAETRPETEYHPHAERLAGWREGLEAAGVDWAAVPAISGPGFDRATGRVAGLRILDLPERPTAVLAFSDLIALGVLDAAAERGVAVPRELSVIGYDDVPEAARAGLTTVQQPHDGKGATAVRRLLDRAEPELVLLPAELVVRSSTAPAD
jgi:DNA-binding LacI/PurR family transcriptional regulator